METHIKNIIALKRKLAPNLDETDLLNFKVFRMWLSKQEYNTMKMGQLNKSPEVKKFYLDQLRKYISYHVPWGYDTPYSRDLVESNLRKMMQAYYYYTGATKMSYTDLGKSYEFQKLVTDLIDSKMSNYRPLRRVPKWEDKDKPEEHHVHDAGLTQSSTTIQAKDGTLTIAAKPAPAVPFETIVESDSLTLRQRFYSEVISPNKDEFEGENFVVNDIMSDDTINEVARIINLHKGDVFLTSPLLYHLIHNYENPLSKARQMIVNTYDQPLLDLSANFLNAYMTDTNLSNNFQQEMDLVIIEDNTQTLHSRIFDAGSFLTSRNMYGAILLQTSLDLGKSNEDYWKSLSYELFQNLSDMILGKVLAAKLASPVEVLSLLRGVVVPQININTGVELATANTDVRNREVYFKRAPNNLGIAPGSIVLYNKPRGATGGAPAGIYEVVSKSGADRFNIRYFDDNGISKISSVNIRALEAYLFTTDDDPDATIAKVSEISLITEPFLFYRKYLSETGQNMDPIQISLGDKEAMNLQVTRFASVFNIRDFRFIKKIENGQSLYIMTFN